MTNAYSFGAVIALWLGTSFLLWLAHRAFRQRSDRISLTLARQTLAVLDAASLVFQEIRGARANPKRRIALTEENLRDDTRVLLNTIEAQSPFFDSAKELSQRIQKTFTLPDFAPLSEILQIRRDLWASAEIILVDDLRDLGPDFADPDAYALFREEARGLLFGPSGQVSGEGGDAVELRLAMAREEARRFAEAVEAELVTRAAKERITRPADIIALPVEMLRSLPRGVSALRAAAGDVLRAASDLAGAMRKSDSVTWSLNELRRARDDLPDRFATAFEKAGGMARQGGQSLKRHYEFLLEARELQARYVEMLQRAPDLSEKARQFLDRLELEKRAEQMRLGSRGLLSRARITAVFGIAWLIRGLQHVQAWITPPENKQLAVITPRTSPVTAPAQAPESERASIRRLLPPERPLAATLDDAAETYRQRRREPRDRLQDDPLPRDGAERVRALFGGRRATPVERKSADAEREVNLRPSEFSAVSPAGETIEPERRPDRTTSGKTSAPSPAEPEKDALPAAAPAARDGFFRRILRSKPKAAARPEKSIREILAAAGSFDSLDDAPSEPEIERRGPPRTGEASLASRLSRIDFAESPAAASGDHPSGDRGGVATAPEPVRERAGRRRFFGGERRS